MAALVFKDLKKNYGELAVVHGINLEIQEGEFVVLVGPSGCGKSTLLRMIAGLEAISSGELRLDNQVINHVPPQQRGIAMVFQSYALYPHLKVYENIAFGPKVRHEAQAQYHPRIAQAAAMLNLTPYLERLPKALSGGQRQRVAMARAVVREPKLFLFDEPLSNLDAKLRLQMRTEIKALHQRLHNTIIYVTHDQIEAMTLADRIVVMNAGRIEQVGTPLDLYDNPDNLFVAGFMGSPAMNFLQGTLQLKAGQSFIQLFNGHLLPIAVLAQEQIQGRQIILGIRPEHIYPSHQAEHALPIHILLKELTGAETLLHGQFGTSSICLGDRQRLAIQVHDDINITWPLDKVHVFDEASGLRISPDQTPKQLH